jgi:hypothetical protein
VIATLTILYCLAARPTECTTRRRDMAGMSGAPMACLIEGQQDGAMFVRDHPAFFVARVSCRIGTARQDDA